MLEGSCDFALEIARFEAEWGEFPAEFKAQLAKVDLLEAKRKAVFREAKKTLATTNDQKVIAAKVDAAINSMVRVSDEYERIRARQRRQLLAGLRSRSSLAFESPR